MTAIDDFLDPLIRALSPELESTLTSHGTTSYLSGSAEMIAWGKINAPDVQLPFEGPPMPQAIKYAETAAGRNIKSMNEETLRRLKRTIANAIEKKTGIPELNRELRKTFGHIADFYAGFGMEPPTLVREEHNGKFGYSVLPSNDRPYYDGIDIELGEVA